MKIEQDRVQILSGVRWGKTLGSPVSLLVENRDWINWQKACQPKAFTRAPLRGYGAASRACRPWRDIEIQSKGHTEHT